MKFARLILDSLKHFTNQFDLKLLPLRVGFSWDMLGIQQAKSPRPVAISTPQLLQKCLWILNSSMYRGIRQHPQMHPTKHKRPAESQAPNPDFDSTLVGPRLLQLGHKTSIGLGPSKEIFWVDIFSVSVVLMVWRMTVVWRNLEVPNYKY